MELLILLGIGLTIGGVALAMDDDDDAVAGEKTTGTEETDDISGTEGDDTVFAREGTDILDGNGGNDRLFGQDGEDVLVGGDGNDFLRGGSDPDLIVDGTGSDTIYGDLGGDLIVSTSAIGSDQAVQAARDYIALEDPDDEIFLELDWSTDTDSDPDEIYAGYGDDAVIAGDGDIVSLGEGADSLFVGDWIDADDDAVTVTDFNTSEDVLVYSHDGQGPLPEFSITRDDDGTGEGLGSALVFADGILIARLSGAGGSFSMSNLSIFDYGENGRLFF
ncbi:hypothetical protein K3722_08560 [Leisingera caerulea]|uniref:Calcium-binding protein n=1 Tax=Leisingera caerulea TaxID=506591 RepID=A0ABY5X179_LEICA|nr:hypothetical protein [Leisingera caerulea]UWQ60168.1 hypothetical protein K3722_08560 [Leisingera caerulea]